MGNLERENSHSSDTEWPHLSSPLPTPSHSTGDPNPVGGAGGSGPGTGRHNLPHLHR